MGKDDGILREINKKRVERRGPGRRKINKSALLELVVSVLFVGVVAVLLWFWCIQAVELSYVRAIR